ncbi:MAG: molybdopterin oxidoreductase family protein [Halovenus sp.]
MSYDGIGEGCQRWPYPADAEEGVDILHTDEFANGEQQAPLMPVAPTPPADSVGDDQLVLTTGRVLAQFNSGALTRRSQTLTMMRGEDVLEIHPEDAEERGIEDGETVVVENERGRVTVTADVTATIQRGVVFCTFHYTEPLANAVTGGELDPVAEIPEYKHSAVTVTPAE